MLRRTFELDAPPDSWSEYFRGAIVKPESQALAV
jgi:hypothetical protein